MPTETMNADPLKGMLATHQDYIKDSLGGHVLPLSAKPKHAVEIESDTQVIYCIRSFS